MSPWVAETQFHPRGSPTEGDQTVDGEVADDESR